LEIKRNFTPNKILTGAGIFIFVAAGFLYVFTHDPSHSENLYVVCIFKTVTGWDCPGCGGQRALYHLLHLDFAKAVRMNAFFVLFLLPYLAILIFYELRKFIFNLPKPRNFFTSNKILWIILIGLSLFGILRNLPYYPFTLFSTT